MRKVNPEQQEAKRRHILDAAISCFGKKGFHNTSTNEICAAAGMSAGNLFHYFPSKQALIAAIVADDCAQMSAMFAQIKADNTSELAALEALAMHTFEWHCNPINARLAIEIAAEASANPEIGKVFHESTIRYRADIADLIRRGQKNWEISDDIIPEQAAVWLLAMADGIAVQLLNPPADVSALKESLRLMIKRLFSGMLKF